MKKKNSQSKKSSKSANSPKSTKATRSTTSVNGGAPLDASAAAAFCDQFWEKEIVPTISEYIAIPNKSPYYDPDWVRNGHMDRAVALVERWLRERLPAGATLEVMRLSDEQGKPRTP